ncbi:MAG: tRNA pseudouridine(55) synthase TruB [Oscillospiraceae bacterium]|nr:tRNA pseudouridine(55) synthase TruB [Oscillospiraceae bacterium]
MKEPKINNILLLNKPEKITSFRAGNRVRGFLSRVTGSKVKVGHTGTLDPMATGCLPVLLNGATRFSQYLPGEKAYRATIKLGITTDTLDRTGNILQTRPVNCSPADVEDALKAFRGEIEQLPPMFSAVSVDGVRLYELARQGKTVERKSRKVTICALELLDARGDEYTIDVTCSAGTYIRTLAADLGEMLGCGACLTALCRTSANGFSLADCITQEELEDIEPDKIFEVRPFFVPIGDALKEYPALEVSQPQASRFSNGGELDRKRCNPIPDGLCRVFSYDRKFLGIARVEGDNIRPNTVISRQ